MNWFQFATIIFILLQTPPHRRFVSGEDTSPGAPCGDPLGSKVFFDINSRPICTDCPGHFYYDRESATCMQCEKNNTNCGRNVMTSCAPCLSVASTARWETTPSSTSPGTATATVATPYNTTKSTGGINGNSTIAYGWFNQTGDNPGQLEVNDTEVSTTSPSWIYNTTRGPFDYPLTDESDVGLYIGLGVLGAIFIALLLLFAKRHYVLQLLSKVSCCSGNGGFIRGRRE